MNNMAITRDSGILLACSTLRRNGKWDNEEVLKCVSPFWDIAGKNSDQPLVARWFLVQLIFDPEDGGDTFLRKVGLHGTKRCYIPGDDNILNCGCESLKSYKLK
jgi:hypothetical protein